MEFFHCANLSEAVDIAENDSKTYSIKSIFRLSHAIKLDSDQLKFLFEA